MKKYLLCLIVLMSLSITGCVEKPISGILTQEEAIEIAQNSDCILEGNLTENIMYNNYTKTWWIDLDLEKPGCKPACVVYEETRNATINWRCTGVIPS